jgi:probable phosphoglycerate mutase
MNDALDILLLRHGQTDANASNVVQGHQPTPLNAIGQEQAMKLARRLAAWTPKIQIVISSDLPRAVQTAEPIAAALDVPVVINAAWRERHFGEMEGKTVEPHQVWSFASGDVVLPGAETYGDFHRRVQNALLAIRSQVGQKRVVAVVTHGGPCRAILRMLVDGRLPLAVDQPAPEIVPIANCSIMHLIQRRDGWQLQSINDAVHLNKTTSLDAG